MSVALVERAPTAGGSAVLSGGYVWTVPTMAAMVEANPLGDPALQALIVEEFDESIQWLDEIGVSLGPRSSISIGIGHQIDVRQYVRRCLELVGQTGFATFDVQTRSLRKDKTGTIIGAVVDQSGERSRISASHTVLATGGFQASPRLRATHIHRNARAMLLRSNEYSGGDGLRLGLAAGAATSPHMDGFYGHLIASPVTRWEESDFARLSQYTSHYGILVNRLGDRFMDESSADLMNAQGTLRQPGARAWLIVDEHIRNDLMGKPHMVGQTWIDRFQTASTAGARYASEMTLAGLAERLAEWGVDGSSFMRTVHRYNTGTLFPDDPPRARWHEPLVAPPFHGLEVQPAITFTHGGLRINADCYALDASAGIVRGLLVAGFDAGGIYHKGYAGGLSVALTMGRVAARTASTRT